MNDLTVNRNGDITTLSVGDETVTLSEAQAASVAYGLYSLTTNERYATIRYGLDTIPAVSADRITEAFSLDNHETVVYLSVGNETTRLTPQEARDVATSLRSDR